MRRLKIWEGNYSEDTIANLMRTSEVVSIRDLMRRHVQAKENNSEVWACWCMETQEQG